MDIRRGDIVEVDFGFPVGSEQGGIRPAIVVQNDVGNKFSPTTIVVPITSSMTKKSLPTHGFLFEDSGCGLPKDSTFTAEQVRVIDKRRITGKYGRATPSQMAKVDVAVAISFAFPTITSQRRAQGVC